MDLLHAEGTVYRLDLNAEPAARFPAPDGGSMDGDPNAMGNQFHLEQREFVLEAPQPRVRFKPFSIRQSIVDQFNQKDVALLIASKPGQLSDYKIQVMALHTFVALQI